MKAILGWEGGGTQVSYNAPRVQIRIEEGNSYLEIAALEKTERKLLAVYVELFADGFVDQENFETIWRQLAYSGRFDYGTNKVGAWANKVVTTILADVGPPEYRREMAINNIKKIHSDCIKGMQEGFQAELLPKYNAFFESGSRWMLESEASQSKYGTDPAKGLLLAKWKSELAITWEPATSVLTIAPPGSGKTQAQVIPALLTYEGSAVVLDVKGEIYEATAGRRQQMGQKIIRWNALDKSGTHRFNPLKAMSRDPDDLWEDCQEMARRLLPDQDGGTDRDPFWRTEARNLVTVFLANMMLSRSEEEQNLALLLSDLSETPKTIAAVCEAHLLKLADEHGIPALRNRANGIRGMILDSPKQFQGVVSTATAELAVFEGGRVSRALSGHDWEPAALFREPTTIYFTVPDRNLSTWGPLLQLLLAQHFSGLRESVRENTGDLPVTFFLDEAGSLGNFPELLEALDRGRGYGVRLWMFFQNLGQIETVYSNPQSITDNVAVRCYMNAQGETAQKLSEELGVVENVMYEEKDPLARAEALAGPQFADDIIIVGQSQYPIRAEKVLAYRDLNNLMMPPPNLFEDKKG